MDVNTHSSIYVYVHESIIVIVFGLFVKVDFYYIKCDKFQTNSRFSHNYSNEINFLLSFERETRKICFIQPMLNYCNHILKFEEKQKRESEKLWLVRSNDKNQRVKWNEEKNISDDDVLTNICSFEWIELQLGHLDYDHSEEMPHLTIPNHCQSLLLFLLFFSRFILNSFCGCCCRLDAMKLHQTEINCRCPIE